MVALRRATARASGLMSQAWTFAEGRFLARARAMQPLPVPTSRMVWALWGCGVGASLDLVALGLVDVEVTSGCGVEASLGWLVVVGEEEERTHSTSSSVSGRGISTFSSTYSFIPANQLSCRTYCTGRWARSSREYFW